MPVQSISPNLSTGPGNLAGGRSDYSHIAGVRGNPHVTDAFIREVEAMAERLGTRPEFLLAVMSFESGGSFRPDIRNGAGSGATGIIQFMPATARELGTSTEALARMSSVEQLQYVERYFANRSSPGDLATLEGVYTTVLYGSPRPDPDSTLFTSGTAAYRMNAPLDLNGDGRITAGEATSKVRDRIDGDLPAGPSMAAPATVASGAAAPATAAGDAYVVRSGDTLWDIAGRHGVSLASLIAANPQIRNPDLIYPDQLVHLPAAAGAPAAAPAVATQPATVSAPVAGDAAQHAPYTVYSTGHGAPVELQHAGQMQPHHSNQTRQRDGQTLEVRDIVLHRDGQSQTAQPVPSPIAGEVIEAGWNGAGGNGVIVRGDDGQIAAVFHLSSIEVKAGDRVEYGQDLGNQGSTGRSTGPHVHVEAPTEVINRWVNDLLDGGYDGRRA